jgi:hypothetical protein
MWNSTNVPGWVEELWQFTPAPKHKLVNRYMCNICEWELEFTNLAYRPSILGMLALHTMEHVAEDSASIVVESRT